MTPLAWWLALACSDPAPSGGSEQPQVRMALDGAPGPKGGRLRLQVEAPDGGSFTPPEPSANGLTFTLVDGPVVEDLGPVDVLSWTWSFEGAAGSYEIPAVRWTWQGPAGPVEVSSSALFVDLGVAPPVPTELEDIVDPAPSWRFPWLVALLAGGAAGLVSLGLWVAFRRPPAPSAAPPPQAPDVRALARWAALRADPALDDFAKARGLSEIYRSYLEEVLRFPALSWTTSEILARLGALAHLPPENLPRARRLLRATDRVKYAEQEPGEDLFDELDGDLRAFIAATRPQRWGET